MVLSIGRGAQLITVQFGGSVAEASISIRMQFVRKVYSIL